MCNYKQEKAIKFSKQTARVKESGQYPKVVSKQDRRMCHKLPSYLHNANNRVALNSITEHSLRQTKTSTQPIYDVPSSINERKSFRVDPNLPIEQ